jgi:hypothetical protein
MSTLNQYGCSSAMNPKLKKMLKEYTPKDKTRDKNGNYFKTSKPVWTQNSMQRIPLKGTDGFLTSSEVTTVCSSILFILAFLWALFNL